MSESLSRIRRLVVKNRGCRWPGLATLRIVMTGSTRAGYSPSLLRFYRIGRTVGRASARLGQDCESSARA